MTVANPETKQDKLFTAFTKPTFEAWKAAAIETLKGAPFDKKLLTPTIDGVTLKPIYNPEDVKSAAAGSDSLAASLGDSLPGQGDLLRGSVASGYLGTGWVVAQEVPYGTPAEFNRGVLESLSHGETSVNVLLDIAAQKGLDPDEAKEGEVAACGLSVAHVGDLETAFKNVALSAVPVYWQAGVAGLPIVALFAAYVDSQKGKKNDNLYSAAKLSELRGSFNLSPFAIWLKAGQMQVSLERAYDELAAVCLWAKKNTPQMGVIGIQGEVYGDAGANVVQQLAYVLAATVEYLRALTQRGVPAEVVLKQTRWIFAVGPHFFTEVAKFRAARVLWASLLKAYGLDAEKLPATLHARTGLYHKTVYDPHVNVLRSSMEAFSAVVGGVESLHVGPYDEILRDPDAQSRRIARNVHTILREECGLGQVIDPSAGSYYVESLTQELAAKAWEKFQCLEKSGGFVQAITSGELQKAVAATTAERTKRFTQRRDVMVGTNQYGVLKETPLEGVTNDYVKARETRAAALAEHKSCRSNKLPASLEKLTAKARELCRKPASTIIDAAIEAAKLGATLAELSTALRENIPPSAAITPLRCARLAFPYERLRALAHKKMPKVFLAAMGSPRDHKARVDFIKGFLEAGAVEALYEKGFPTAEDAAKALATASAATSAGIKVAIICGSDETYPTVVPEVAKALKAANPNLKVYLAGAPAAEHEAAYRAAGMDDSISIKSNNLDTLQKIIDLY